MHVHEVDKNPVSYDKEVDRLLSNKRPKLQVPTDKGIDKIPSTLCQLGHINYRSENSILSNGPMFYTQIWPISNLITTYTHN